MRSIEGGMRVKHEGNKVCNVIGNHHGAGAWQKCKILFTGSTYRENEKKKIRVEKKNWRSEKKKLV